MQPQSTLLKRAGLGLFLFFLLKGLLWLALLGTAAAGIGRVA